MNCLPKEANTIHCDVASGPPLHLEGWCARKIEKAKVIHVPTDYFPPRDEFDEIVDATYVYGDRR